MLGPVRAIVKALDLAGADLPLEGQLVVAAPGRSPRRRRRRASATTTPLATWVMVLTAAGQTAAPCRRTSSRRPATQTALGPAYIQICLPPPDVPAGTPGRATFGAKLYSAELTINGVFSAVAAGAWISFWTPYTPGVGTAERGRTVASPGRDRSGRRDPRRQALGEGRDRFTGA